MNLGRIYIYLFVQIFKYFFLILFIFLSVAWLLQITRLFTITNFMYIEIIDIIVLSFYLIPNIITTIIPFIIIFGLLLCFNKLNKDNELISILSLGLGLSPFRKTLVFFSLIIVCSFAILNFYLAPKVYEQYKIQEHDLRNKFDFDNMEFSNFLNLNKTTILDFKKVKNEYHDIIISFKDEKENIVYAEKGNIVSNNNKYNFQLTNGFKISIDRDKEIEKLEFLNYILKIDNNNPKKNEISDKNTFTIFNDLESKNYLNITFKLLDIILIFYIIFLFYENNLKKINFSSSNNVFFTFICISVLLINQVLKNSEIILLNYSLIILSIIIISYLISYIKRNYEKN